MAPAGKPQHRRGVLPPSRLQAVRGGSQVRTGVPDAYVEVQEPLTLRDFSQPVARELRHRQEWFPIMQQGGGDDL